MHCNLMKLYHHDPLPQNLESITFFKFQFKVKGKEKIKVNILIERHFGRHLQCAQFQALHRPTGFSKIQNSFKMHHNLVKPHLYPKYPLHFFL